MQGSVPAACPSLAALALAALAGCAGRRPLTLMPTPALFEDRAVEPFSHVAGPLQTPETRAFFATNRSHRAHDPERPYGDGVDDELHLGAAIARIGAPGIGWDELVELALVNPPDSNVPVTLEDVAHWDSLIHRASRDVVDWDERSHGRFVKAINEELPYHPDQEIRVYVHGTKRGFEAALAMTGEIEHFAGRDSVGVAFACRRTGTSCITCSASTCVAPSTPARRCAT